MGEIFPELVLKIANMPVISKRSRRIQFSLKQNSPSLLFMGGGGETQETDRLILKCL